ncbi:MAG: hypothetical protein L3J42_01400 [Hydrogenimonas sp.]|nr:hypothetical protein [Hydrogenimonas sp.]
MTLLFLLIAAVAGVVVLVYERRQREENIVKLQNYVAKVISDASLLDREKMVRVMDLFTQNGYKVEDMKESMLTVSRREFSVGAALLWFSLGGVGFVLYLIYYFLKEPESLRVDLRGGTIAK